MGKPYSKLKQENRALRAENKALREEFVEKHHVQSGDIVVFKTAAQGLSFGYGVAGLTNLQRQISEAAGGAVIAMVTPPHFTIETLTAKDQKALRGALDKLDALRGPTRAETSVALCNTKEAGGSMCALKAGHPNYHESLNGKRWYGFQLGNREEAKAKAQEWADHPETLARALEGAELDRKIIARADHLKPDYSKKVRFCHFCGKQMFYEKLDGPLQRVICKDCVKERL